MVQFKERHVGSNWRQRQFGDNFLGSGKP